MSKRIIYIGGYSRSGSTLLSRLLGEFPGLLAVGELFDLWQRSYIQNQRCGCGKVFGRCDFWREVTLLAFRSTPDQVDGRSLQKLRSRVQGHGHILQLWAPPLRTPAVQQRIDEYVNVLTRIYDAIGLASGAQFIVDSSKVPQYAWLLSEMPETELHMIHLIRDSRATAYSWQRRRLRPEIAWKVQHMDQHSVVRSALEWDAFNLMLRRRRRSLASYTVIRYEDLVAYPATELDRIARNIGFSCGNVQFTPANKLTLHVSHTASGNPSRFSVGETSLRSDDEWLEKMRIDRKYLVSLLTVGGLARYGYLRPPRSPAT